MVRIDVEYVGELRCRAVHEPSQAQLQTDAPRDNHGKGEAFSPTDTLATALATCMLTVMGIAARKLEVTLDGARARVEKHMTSEPPRRVAKLVVELTFAQTGPIDDSARRALEHAGETCPVRLSLSDTIEVVTRYDWSSVKAQPS